MKTHSILVVTALLTLLTSLPGPAEAQRRAGQSAPPRSGTAEQSYAVWAQPAYPVAEYRARRDAMLARLSAEGGVLLVPSADGITRGETFRQLDDFLYFTGLELPRSLLVLDGRDGTATLFLPARDFRFDNAGRPNDFPGRPLGDDPAVAALSGLERTRPASEIDAALADFVLEGRTLLVNVGHPGPVTDPALPAVGQLGPISTLVLGLRARHPGLTLRNAYAHVAHLRMIKSPREIASMQRAADATAEAIRTAAASVAPGIDEATLQGIFEATCRREGSALIPFTPIVKSGPNSLWPWRILAAHTARRNRVMEDGDAVILDVGCEADGYVSDVGRTFPVGMRFSAAQREKLEMITRVADAIITAIRPGVTFADLTRVAYEAIPDAEERYMQTPSYFGHHIGLSSGDPALSDEPLAPGMVFTVEPWYYNHDLEISVFVEDVVLVTEDGAEVLTRALPRSADALEEMAR